jgi:hypothetical protein
MGPDEHILVYANDANGAKETLREVVQSTVPAASVEVYNSVESLSERLSSPLAGYTVIVILANTKQDLMEILSLQSLLFDHRVILILPDKEPDTMAIGHRLRPRFVSFRDGDFSDVGAVLQKMISPHSQPDKQNTGR